MPDSPDILMTQGLENIPYYKFILNNAAPTPGAGYSLDKNSSWLFLPGCQMNLAFW
jgi:hypothetical protein